MKPRDEDELWREIVENYGERPSTDDVSAEADSNEIAPETHLNSPSASTPYPDGVSQPALDSWYDEGSFVPPTPEPLPCPTPTRLAAWFGVFGVPMVMLLAVLAGLWFPQWLSVLLASWFVGGFLYLVLSMPRQGRDPWDDGSRL